MRRWQAVLTAGLMLGFAASAAKAGPISGDGPLGDFTGSIVVTSTGANSATLTLTITNANTTAAGGKITAIVFNNPSSLITGATLNPNPPPAPAEAFGLSFGTNSNSANPFGDFDFLLSTGGGFEGGGSPNSGLLVGETGVFTLNLTGTGVGALTADNFVNALSNNPGGGGAQFFAVRFRGFNNGGSDKVTGVSVNTAAVPEPSTLLCCVTAGIGVGLFGRFRRRPSR